MKIIPTSVFVFLVIGCSLKKRESASEFVHFVRQPDTIAPSSSSQTSSDAAAEDTGHVPIEVESQSVRIVNLDVKSESSAMKRAAPEPILLPPAALMEIYRPVFGEKPRPPSVDFFTAAESDDLGAYRILSPNIPRAGSTPANPSMVWLRGLSSDYVFSLRRFAAGACGNLVNSELMNPNSTDNKLVQGEVPSLGKINGFLTALLGYQEIGKPHEGVDKYLAAFAKMRTAEPLPKTADQIKNRLRSSYNHLCVALATDVRVFYR